MNKNLLFVLLAVPALTQAQTRTTVAPGNVTNPFNWDCTCVPLPGNNIVINHEMVLDVDFAYSSGSVTINASGALTGVATDRIFGVNGGSFTNYGLFTVYNMFHSGGTFTNQGLIQVTNGFAIGGTVTTNNYAELDVLDSLLIDVNATLNTSNLTNAKYTATAGTLNNTGQFVGTDIWNSGTITNTTGMGFSIENLYTSGTVTNNALLDIDNDFYNSENVTNNHQVRVDHDLLNGDTVAGTAVFTNNGTISVMNDLANSETMNGTGSWCVANTTSNAGDVGGTISFCDQTGDNFDNNIGTIAGTVTFCTAGACSIGMQENENGQAHVYPNPVSDRVNVEMQTAGTYQLVLVNALGETVHTQNFTGTKIQLSTNELSPGIYLYRVSGHGVSAAGTIVKE